MIGDGARLIGICPSKSNVNSGREDERGDTEWSHRAVVVVEKWRIRAPSTRVLSLCLGRSPVSIHFVRHGNETPGVDFDMTEGGPWERTGVN